MRSTLIVMCHSSFLTRRNTRITQTSVVAWNTVSYMNLGLNTAQTIRCLRKCDAAIILVNS